MSPQRGKREPRRIQSTLTRIKSPFQNLYSRFGLSGRRLGKESPAGYKAHWRFDHQQPRSEVSRTGEAGERRIQFRRRRLCNIPSLELLHRLNGWVMEKLLKANTGPQGDSGRCACRQEGGRQSTPLVQSGDGKGRGEEAERRARKHRPGA